jgi:hypothetical protein
MEQEKFNCKINDFSSRVCELGTKSCTVYHDKYVVNYDIDDICENIDKRARKYLTPIQPEDDEEFK